MGIGGVAVWVHAFSISTLDVRGLSNSPSDCCFLVQRISLLRKDRWLVKLGVASSFLKTSSRAV